MEFIVTINGIPADCLVLLLWRVCHDDDAAARVASYFRHKFFYFFFFFSVPINMFHQMAQKPHLLEVMPSSKYHILLHTWRKMCMNKWNLSLKLSGNGGGVREGGNGNGNGGRSVTYIIFAIHDSQLQNYGIILLNAWFCVILMEINRSMCLCVHWMPANNIAIKFHIFFPFSSRRFVFCRAALFDCHQLWLLCKSIDSE